MLTLSLGSTLAILALGFIVGIISGMLGIGGGVIVVRILVIGFGFDQKLANGTSLMMLCPPAGVPAIIRYFRAGNINMAIALLLMGGFVLGAWIGAKWANAPWMPSEYLRIGFAFFILFMAGMMLFRSEPAVRAVAFTLLIVATYSVAYVTLKLIGKKWDKQIPNAPDFYRARMTKPFAPDYEI